MATPDAPLTIVADIGGTNTRVALARGGAVLPDSLRHVRNAGRAGLEPILADYLAGMDGARPDLCCVAVAGPIRDGQAMMTNLDWHMSEASLARATGAGRAILLNDLQAQGHALGHVDPGRIRAVVDGPVVADAPMLVVGLGTGVNAAPVHGTGVARVVLPSECGHVTLPVTCEDDFALARFIESLPPEPGRTRRASVEEALSGRGLANIHGFLAARAGVTAAGDSHAIIHALAMGDALARASVAMQVRLLGQVLGDLALIHMPYGGIFLIGGMARALAPFADQFGLAATFRAPRWIDLLEHAFRVSVIEDDNAALLGCAVRAALG
ncbi:MAG: glucokinase [Rubellimicrobium sp.]|nr:glucokinase [Rubellimicrobium sp.]